MTRNPRGRDASGCRVAVCSVAAIALAAIPACPGPVDAALVTASIPVALAEKAAAVQWDAGVLVLAGVLTRSACLLGCAAVAYTTSHIGERLPLFIETGTARPLALASALVLFLLACSGRQAQIPPPGRARLQDHRLPSAPRPLITALHRTELS